uniref:Uncharacterized protein n=1 Tax=Photinus pyralis TaxID=7054 RepID=A0A1Y1L2B0_PHOPY
MALIGDLLREFKPSTWSTENYASKKFVRIPLDIEAVECTAIKNEFIRHYCAKYKIVAIERIQAPFLYMRCQLHRTHYKMKNGPYIDVSESWEFAFVQESKVDEFIQYNGDERRVPSLCYLYLPSANIPTCAIAKKVLHPCLLRDSNGYPDYIIHFEKTKPADEIANSLSRLTLRM